MTARLVRLLERRGRDARAVCGLARISLEEVTSPSARVPYGVADRLLEACAEELGASGLSIAIAGVFDENTYDAAGLMLMSSATFGEGLERAFAYQRLWGDGERFTLVRDGGFGIVRFRHPGPSPLARAVLSELALVETMFAARMLVDPHARAASVRFAHEPLSPRCSALAHSFGADPVFGAPESELVLDEGFLRAPIRVPEGAIARAMEVLAKRALADLPESASLAGRVRAICRDDPNAFSLDVPAVAQRLHMSARTLQRRLHAEGTSWAELVDDLRRKRAKELTLRGASEKEISFLLGFSDTSALLRARARWTRR
jgi:AraC-like DNA-binding protein